MLVVSFDVGIKNLAYAVARVDKAGANGANCPSGLVTVARWGTACVCPTNARALTRQSAVELVVRALDELDFLECDTVLVEAQPRFAPQNVHVAHAIATYFVVRKRADLDEPVAVHFVHASLKNALGARVLAAAGSQRCTIDKSCTLKYAKYARNKRQAIAACESLVSRDASLNATWEAFAKKDDAADALLQLVAWTNCTTVAAGP